MLYLSDLCAPPELWGSGLTLARFTLASVDHGYVAQHAGWALVDAFLMTSGWQAHERNEVRNLEVPPVFQAAALAGHLPEFCNPLYL